MMQHTQKMMLVPMERYTSLARSPITEKVDLPNIDKQPLGVATILTALPKSYRSRAKTLLSHI